MALIQYQKVNKEAGNEWFTIESNKTGTRWTGKVWYVHDMVKYEFDLEFELPVAYPNVRGPRNACAAPTRQVVSARASASVGHFADLARACAARA